MSVPEARLEALLDELHRNVVAKSSVVEQIVRTHQPATFQVGL